MRRPRSESKAEARGESLLPPPGSIPASEGLEEARPQRGWEEAYCSPNSNANRIWKHPDTPRNNAQIGHLQPLWLAS